MESIFIKTENFKTTEPLKFVLNLSEGLYQFEYVKDVRIKTYYLQNMYIYYTTKNKTTVQNQ